MEKLLQQFPRTVAEKLAPYASLSALWSFLDRALDFAHGPSHIIPMRAHSLLIAREGQLTWPVSDDDIGKLMMAISVHDAGYKLTPDILAPSEHHYGSALIAQLLFNDDEVTRGVLLHSQDLLPDDTPRWIRVLQDGDRISRMGWPLALWATSYLGFTHPNLKHIPQRVQNQSHNYLWDLRHPRLGVKHRESYLPASWYDGGGSWQTEWTNYEWRVERFVRKEILPFLIKNNLAHSVIEQCRMCIDWFIGQEVTTDYPPPPGTDVLWDKYGDGVFGWTITPIGEMAQALFTYKLHNTDRLLQALERTNRPDKVQLRHEFS